MQKFYPDRLRFGSRRAKNLFLSKNSTANLCLCLAVNKSSTHSRSYLYCELKLVLNFAAFVDEVCRVTTDDAFSCTLEGRLGRSHA